MSNGKRGVSGTISKDFLSVLRPQFVQSSSAQRAAGHDALRFGTIDNFPRFTDTLLRRKLFVKFGFETPPAPHSLDENRFEGEGSSDFVPRHGRGKRPMSIVQRPILNSELRCRISFCHWTFNVRCWMFGVSVLISDFRRLTSG